MGSLLGGMGVSRCSRSGRSNRSTVAWSLCLVCVVRVARGEQEEAEVETVLEDVDSVGVSGARVDFDTTQLVTTTWKMKMLVS